MKTARGRTTELWVPLSRCKENGEGGGSLDGILCQREALGNSLGEASKQGSATEDQKAPEGQQDPGRRQRKKVLGAARKVRDCQDGMQQH